MFIEMPRSNGTSIWSGGDVPTRIRANEKRKSRFGSVNVQDVIETYTTQTPNRMNKSPEQIIKGKRKMWAKQRFNFIVDFHNKGVSDADIGKLLKISKQRVWQIYRYGINRLTGGERKKMYYEADHRCQACKRSSFNLHAHHVGSTRDNSPKNLMVLCPSCHGKVEQVKQGGVRRGKKLSPEGR